MKKILAILAAVAVVVAFSVPASAGEWSFYGSSRMTTFWEDYDKDAGDDADLTWALQGNSRIGANVKAGDVWGQFEYGSGPNLRILRGGWNFGAGTLAIGQMYTPFMTLYSNQVWGSDNDLVGTGGTYTGRQQAIDFTFGGLRLGFIKNVAASKAGAVDRDIEFPKLEGRYLFKMGGVSLELGGLYQTYKLVNAAAKETSVDSWGVNLGATMAVGPVALKASGYIGQNLADAGFVYTTTTADRAAYNAATGRVTDADSYGFQFIAGYTLSDMVALEAGYGYATAELDASGADKDDVQSYYIQAVLSLAKGVYIIPEIGVVDYKQNAAGADQGKLTYFGAKWQINF